MTPVRAPIAVVAAPMTHVATPEIAMPAAPERVETVAAAESPAPHGRRHHTDRTQLDDGHTTGHGTEIIGLGTDDGGDDVLGPDLVLDAHRSLQH